MTAPAFPPTDAPLTAPFARGYPSHLAPHPEPTLFLLSLPWLISAAFHLGIALLAAFIAFATYQALNPANPDQIIIPSTFEDPSYSDHPGGIPNPGLGDPSKESAAQRLKDLAKAEGWANTSSQNPADMLGGQSGEAEVAGIFRGMGGNMGTNGANATGEAKAGAYGSGGGQGIGPKSSFYGTGGNASRIVYIIDCSGSMISSFEFVKKELRRSSGSLVPLQFFNVVTVGTITSRSMPTIDQPSRALGPPGTLLRATPENRKLIADQLDKIIAQGLNDDVPEVFIQAFDIALRMKPQMIYFLADGNCSPEVATAVAKMNKDHVKILTLSYEDLTELQVSNEKLQAIISETQKLDRIETMKKIARENGGTCKLVFEARNKSVTVNADAAPR